MAKNLVAARIGVLGGTGLLAALGLLGLQAPLTLTSTSQAEATGTTVGPNLTLTNTDGICPPGGPCPAETFTLNSGEVIQVNLAGGSNLYWTEAPASTNSAVVTLQSESTDASGDATAMFKVVGPGTANLTAGATTCSDPTACPAVQPWTVGIIGKLAAAMSMSVTPTSSVYGEPVKLVAGFPTSSGTNPVPTGTVDFYDNDGQTLIGSAPLVNMDPNGDWATMTISTLSGGTHVLTASYAGDGTFSGSSAVGVFVTVNPAPTQMAATPAVLQISGLHVYAFTVSATLSRSDTGTPVVGQEVDFSAGSTALCSADTDATGTARCDAVTGALSIVAAQGYSVSFAGTSDYKSSSTRAGLVS